MALSAELTDCGYRSIRVYTLAMRFPRMVGKGFNGERLPGGPYTVPQFVGGGMIFGLSGISAYYCPIGNPIINVLIGAGLAFLVGGALANIPVDGIRLTTRLRWLAGLLVSRAPSTTEVMPTGSPLALVGGDVMVLSSPRQSKGGPPRRATQHPTGSVQGSGARPARPAPAGTPLTVAAPAAAAAVFSALTGR